MLHAAGELVELVVSLTSSIVILNNQVFTD